MDNFSHTLAGMTVAAAVCSRVAATPRRRTLFFAASVAANNFPDLDLLYSNAAPPPLGYLLHHRGHTHTLGGAVGEILLLLGILYLIPAFRKELADPRTRALTCGIAALGLALHMVMDGWNSYGVHPFWPLSSRWFYGDAVFIMEPVVWVALTVPLFFQIKSRLVKVVLALLAFGVPVAASSLGFVTAFSLVFLAGIAGVLALMRRLRWGVGVVAAFVALQSLGSAKMRDQLIASLPATSPTHRVLDVAMSPMPANPFCWATARLEVDPAQDFFQAVTADTSLLPPAWQERLCPPQEKSLAIAGSLTQLRDALAKDCHLEAWLRFTRIPALAQGAAFDLRFSRAAMKENFTRLPEAGSVRDCPPLLPTWDHPRQDLLGLLKPS